MRKSIGRFGSAALELLLPSARAEACTSAWCQASGGKRRCCKLCPGGETVCTPYVSGSCTDTICGP